METNIEAKKVVYNKSEFDRVIDRGFSFYLQKPEIPPSITIAEFFDAYEALYYEIPTIGEDQSHQYLIKRSSELVKLESDVSDVQPLLDEITLLREQILEYQNQIIALNTPS